VNESVRAHGRGRGGRFGKEMGEGRREEREKKGRCLLSHNSYPKSEEYIVHPKFTVTVNQPSFLLRQPI